MESPSIERRLSAIVAMDVVGYSRLMGVDERGTLRALKAHRSDLLEPAVAAHHGRIVKSTGDGLLLEFASVVDAIACAVEIQRGMLARNAEVPEDRRIVFRMGVNIGDIIVDGGDIFGDGVNVAARLEALCEPGGICISRAANEQVRDKLSLSFADLGEHLVKNISRAVGVYGLSPSQIASLPGAATGVKQPRIGGARHRRPVAIAAGIAAMFALIAGGWWYADWFGMVGGGDLDKDVADALTRSLPGVSEKVRSEVVAAYIKSSRSRALAVAPRAGRMWRTTGWPNADAARERVLERCQVYYDEPCALVAVDDSVIPPSPNNATTLWDMPRVRYQGPFDVARIPALRDKDLQRADVTRYKAAPGPKAAALHAEGILRVIIGAASQTAAEQQALQACNTDRARRSRSTPCVLYATGDRVVLTMRAKAPITSTGTPSAQPKAISTPSPQTVPAARPSAATISAALSKAAPSLAESALNSIVTAYLQERQSRALAAFPPSGTWRTAGWINGAIAEERALEGCQLRYGEPCVVVAINDAAQAPSSDGKWPRREMPRLRYDGGFDVRVVPIVADTVRERLDVAGYRVQPAPKAAAIHPIGIFSVTVGAASQRDAEQKALAACNADVQKADGDGPCYLYAVGDQVVLRRRSAMPLSAAPEVRAAPDLGLPTAVDGVLAKAAPSLRESVRATIVAGYVQDRQHKALTVFPPTATWRTSGWASAAAAEERALESCQLRYGGPCALVAIDETIQPPAPDGSWARREMPRIAYDGTFDVRQIPIVGDVTRRRADVSGYRQQQGPKAVAIHPTGRLFVVSGAATQREVEQKALADCNADPQRKGRDGPCFLYAAGDQVVLRQRRTTPLAAAP